MKSRLLTILLLSGGVLVSCNETSREVDSTSDVMDIASEDTAVMYNEDNLMAGAVLEADEEEFKDVNFNAPAVEDAELKNAGVGVRGADNYRIYSVGEDIMFDLDKANIRPSGEEKLQQIVTALNKRGSEGRIRVYGFTDSLASNEYNMDLARERAKSVEDWLRNNSGLDTARLKIVPMGEKQFEATNETSRGRQQNRRVEIVVVEK